METETRTMIEHLGEQEIERYRRRQDLPGHRQIIAAHLAVCESCLEQVLNSEHSSVAVDALTDAFLPPAGDPPFHLSPDEMKSYAAGASAKADQIICESHIEICEACAEELSLLSKAERGQSLVRPWASRRFVTPTRLAAAVALIGLLALAALVWRQTSSRPAPSEAVNKGAQPTPETGPAQDSRAQVTPSPNPESVAPTAAVVASLKDNNREISLDQAGTLTGLEGFDESSKKAVKAALAGESLAKPRVLEGLSSPPITLLGEPGENTFQVYGPAGKVISEWRPTLSWQPLSGATSYVVSIFDNNFNRVASSLPLSTTNWTVNKPLRWGQSYFWEVTATKDGREITAPVAPGARAQFKLLEADKLNALLKLQKQRPVSHLALGLMYARFGMMSEAEGEFRQLVKENPDSGAAKKLLRTVQGWR